MVFETPALNADGSLKDASEIQFARSRSGSPAGPAKAVTTGGFTFMTPMVPEDLGRKKRALSSATVASIAQPAKRSNTGAGTTTGSTAPTADTPKRNDSSKAKAKAKKKSAVDRVKSLAEGLRVWNKPRLRLYANLETVSIDVEEVVEQAENDKKTRKKGDGSADVLTVFKELEAEGGGYECQICLCVISLILSKHTPFNATLAT
jgi:hypothetical protein